MNTQRIATTLFRVRHRWLHAALYFVIVLGALHAQMAAVADEHSHAAGAHCCDLCHHGQMPLVQQPATVGPVAPNSFEWGVRAEAGSQCPYIAFPETPSRAPPLG